MRSLFNSLRFLCLILSAAAAQLLLHACHSILADRPADPCVDDYGQGRQRQRLHGPKNRAFKVSVASKTRSAPPYSRRRPSSCTRPATTRSPQDAPSSASRTYTSPSTDRSSPRKGLTLVELAFLTAALHRRGVRTHAMLENEGGRRLQGQADRRARSRRGRQKQGDPGQRLRRRLEFARSPNEIGVKKTTRGLIYKWGENSYGAGKDNDQI